MGMVVCEMCDQAFKAPPSAGRRFCGNSCATRWRWREGIEFERPKGEDNHKWKGGAVGYGALHAYMRRHHPSPGACAWCGATGPRISLANVTGTYDRDLANWEYLCATCHNRFDNARRPETERPCENCGEPFRSRQVYQRFCRTVCAMYARKFGAGVKIPRRRADWLKEQGTPRLPMECLNCGESFLAKHTTTKYCRPMCGTYARRYGPGERTPPIVTGS